LLLEITAYFQRAASLPTQQHLSPTKSGISTGMSRRVAAETIFFHCPVHQRLLFLICNFLEILKP